MLIGLTGRAGAGKDTVYETLAELYGDDLPVERRAFADPLYESAATALGVTAEDLRRWKRGQGFLVTVLDNASGQTLACQTVRSYLQRYGTEAHRDVFGEDFWTNAVDLEDHRGRIVAVTDVRFHNEAQAVLRAGGTVVHVIGPDDDTAAEHASERPLDDDLIGWVIDNIERDDGRLRLTRRVARMVEALRHTSGEEA